MDSCELMLKPQSSVVSTVVPLGTFVRTGVMAMILLVKR